MIVITLMIVVRLIALDADPPPWLSWSTGIGTDEGFYTLDARHEALFGHWAPGNFHDRLLSPLLSVLQQAIFAVAGPNLLTARLLSVSFGLLTVWVLWLGLRRVSGLETADAAALFLGFAPPFVFYNRLALQETPTVFWLTLAFALWAMRSGRSWRLLSGIAFAIAVIFKPLALLALPAFFWLWHKSHPVTAWLGVAGTLAVYGFVWYVPHHAELERMATFYRVHQMQPKTLISFWLNVRRGVWGGERGVCLYLLALLPVPVILAGWGVRRPEPLGRFFALWLGFGLVFCLCSSYAPSRYYVLFLPAIAGSAALGLTGISRSTLRVSVVCLFLLVSTLWCGQAWRHRTASRQNASVELSRLLPRGSIVIGEFAPALCLDTKFSAAPVQPRLSNDDRPVERLHATDIAVTRVAFWEQWWWTRYPGVVRPSHRVATFVLGGSHYTTVDLYSVSEPPNFHHED